MGEHRKRRKANTPNEILGTSIETQELLINEHDIVLEHHSQKTKKYLKEHLKVDNCYNMLEYYYIVKVYMMRKHNVQSILFELLFYLYPKKYFTLIDYKKFPTNYTYKRIEIPLQKGWIELFRNHRLKTKRIYRLSRKSRHLVMDFYRYLSGEKQIPTNRANNPLFAGKKNTPREDKIRQMMIEMSQREGATFQFED